MWPGMRPATGWTAYSTSEPNFDSVGPNGLVTVHALVDGSYVLRLVGRDFPGCDLAPWPYRGVWADGELYEIDDVPKLARYKKHDIELVIDRLAYWYYHPREWLKKVSLMDGVYLLNSPFTFQSMEKHAAYCAMMRLGLPVPDQDLLPRGECPGDGDAAEVPARQAGPLAHEQQQRREPGDVVDQPARAGQPHQPDGRQRPHHGPGQRAGQTVVAVSCKPGDAGHLPLDPENQQAHRNEQRADEKGDAEERLIGPFGEILAGQDQPPNRHRQRGGGAEQDPEDDRRDGHGTRRPVAASASKSGRAKLHRQPGAT